MFTSIYCAKVRKRINSICLALCFFPPNLGRRNSHQQTAVAGFAHDIQSNKFVGLALLNVFYLKDMNAKGRDCGNQGLRQSKIASILQRAQDFAMTRREGAGWGWQGERNGQVIEALKALAAVWLYLQ